MLLIPQILVRTFALGASAVALAACGQQGPLYLPSTGTATRAPERSASKVSESKTPAIGTSPLPLAPQPATATSAP